MAWIESHQELGRHPKTKKFARAAGISLPAAVGHLQYLWWWALDYALDGNLSKFEPEDVADAMLWDGDPQALLCALSSAGFVDADMNIHDWDEYTGRLMARRDAKKENTRARVKKHRELKRHEPQSVGECNAPVTRYSNECNAPVTQCNAPTVPNLTVPYLTQPNLTVETNVSCRETPTPCDEGEQPLPETALAKQAECAAEIREVVAFLNLTLGTRYKPSSKSTASHIRARLREGYTLDDFKTVILRKHAEWGNDPKMCAFLRPETLFGGKFESYVNQQDRAPPVTARSALEELYFEVKKGDFDEKT